MTASYLKAANAFLDWQWDWTAWLAEGETILTAIVTADADLVVDISSNTTTTVTAWLSGGTDGTSYRVHCHVTTSQGRQDTRSVVIDVTPR